MPGLIKRGWVHVGKVSWGFLEPSHEIKTHHYRLVVHNHTAVGRIQAQSLQRFGKKGLPDRKRNGVWKHATAAVAHRSSCGTAVKVWRQRSSCGCRAMEELKQAACEVLILVMHCCMENSRVAKTWMMESFKVPPPLSDFQILP